MANRAAIASGNVPGNFFVDTSCIDCDQCREIAPATFGDGEGHARVWRQPDSTEATERATMALVTCPVGAIGAADRQTLGPNLAKAYHALPERIEDDVFFCGFASSASFGASSYLATLPDGNVLIDSPRYAARLLERLEEMGGVRWMFLSHQDDIADHARFHERFDCERIFHRAEARSVSLKMERLIEDNDPQWIAPDLLVIPTPGHTAGHMSLLYRNRFLFTGDHLWWSPERGELHASRRYCWYSWSKQIESMERLLEYSFEWVLPGHGRRYHASAAVMRDMVADCVTRMKRQ